MKQNITAITIFLLICSPNVFSDFLFIDPPVTNTPTTPDTTPTTPDTTPTTPTDIIPPPQAKDDLTSLVIGVQTTATGNVIDNDLNSDKVTINDTLIGEYGALQLNSSGEYTYTLFPGGSNFDDLEQETEVKDVFKYTAFNQNNEQSIAKLTIQLVTKPNAVPSALNDTASLVIGVQTDAVGNVISNDFNVTGVIINGSLIGKYGALELKTTGEYTYTLFQGSNDILENDKKNEIFSYTAFNAVNEQATATLTIELISKLSPEQATSNIVVARDDNIVIRTNSVSTITSSVTTNDDSSTSSETVTSTRTKSVQLNSSANSPYGFLVLNVDGTFIYTLYNGAPNVLALKFGDTITDSFVYTYFDELGKSAAAKLNITIIGNPIDSAGNTIFDSANIEEPSDTFTIIDAGGETLPILTGKVTSRTIESNANSIQINSDPANEYGFLLLNSDGSFTYNLYRDAPSVLALNAGEIATDNFSYTFLNQFGQKTTANLKVLIIGNPLDSAGNTIHQDINGNTIYDNVDIEFNDRFSQATPLNSSRKIRGHLHDPSDKDWYTLPSEGNEIISLEMCPKGNSCFGKKSWVLYVFDADLITTEMEEKLVTFERFIDETSTNADLAEDQVISGISRAGESNHLYLSYRVGFFDGALIGVIDPCIDSSNSLDIGVGETKKNYLIAVSSPLRGDKDTETSDGCGNGSVILERPGRSVLGKDAETPAADKLYTTTEKYISASPYSDDQYVIKVTGSGVHPLLSAEAQLKSATYNPTTGEFIIPKVRVFNELYEANLKPEDSTTTNADKNTLKFVLNKLNSLGTIDLTNSFQATYDSSTQQVVIPRVTDTSDGKAYSVILQYFPPANGKIALFEVTSFILIK